MGVFVDLTALEQRHYFRRPGDNSAHFAERKMQTFVDRYGDDFCLFIRTGRGSWYVVPYASIKACFTSATLKDYDGKGCWRVVVDESANVVRVDGAGAKIPLESL
jgi:hypothetical protein